MKNTKLFNLLRSIIDPNATVSNDGFLKLSKVKSMRIFDAIMTLIPLFQSGLGQALLSHNTYQKTGSNTIADGLHKLVHGIPYTETSFNEDKGKNGAPVSLRL